MNQQIGRVMQASKPTPASNRPEKKFAAAKGGISVAIWRNRVVTPRGERVTRSVTISPRRYKNAQGEWKDAPSLQPSELPVLAALLQQAWQFILTHPINDHAGEQ